MSTLLDMRGVTFCFGERTVLSDVSLSVAKGSCTALIGPNGVGKTTLLRLAAGGLTPDAGSVTIEQRDLSTISRKERAKLVALVPQQLDIPFDFTVEQIVEQGRSPYLGFLHGQRQEDRLAVDRALELVDATSLRRRIFNEVSGGERQRVKIALGLAQEPRLLLLDEPTQNLDIGRQVEFLDLLKTLRDAGLTILASMHDLSLVPDHFDRVLLLEAGRALTSGLPGEVLTPLNLARAFHCAPGRHPLLRGDVAPTTDRQSLDPSVLPVR